MLLRPRQIALAAAAAALATWAACVPVVLLRGNFDPWQLAEEWDFLLAAPFCAALAVAGALGCVAWQARRPLEALAGHLRAVRTNPTRTLVAAGSGPTHIQTLGPAQTEIEALCVSYRQALAARVKQGEALEAMRSRLDSGDGPRPAAVRAPGASRSMVARLTPNLRWLNATPALQRLLGYAGSELNGRAFVERVHPRSAPAVQRAFTASLQSGEAHNCLFRFLVRRRRHRATLDGPPRAVTERRYVRMDVITRYTDEGQPLHLRCYFEDVTDRVKAEKKLRRRTDELEAANERLIRTNQDLQRLKESYRDLYHNAPIMFFSLDADGHFVACNDTMVQALGFGREGLHGQPYTRLLTADGVVDWKRACAAGGPTNPHPLMSSGEIEMQWVKQDGTVIDVWLRSLPLTDNEGHYVRSRSAAQDVTQRNRLANELRRRRDELEQANEELRAINKELDEFTSVVSHDLKEPLRTLEAYCNLLAEDFSTQLGADGFEYINHMLTASRRLARLIDDLLTLSRAGRIATTPRVFHLNEAVAVVRRDLGDMIQRKGATFTVEGPLPALVGDAERVTQLLSNLVANGLKYNTSSKPTVALGEATLMPALPGFVTLFVRDNGIGIDPKFHKEIFGIFRRLHRKEEFEGTGAGLAICKKIVQAHAGKLWVESAPGQGSTFYFSLPRSPEAAAALLPAPGSADGNGGAVAPAASARLLLVEDMPEMGLIVQRLARKAGHDVHWVQTAEDAWDHLQKHRPDLVLLDIHLPGMNGIELCRRLRELPQQADLPIALFSQGALPEDISAGLAAGANYVLSKELLCQPESWRRRLSEVLLSMQEAGGNKQ
jgi:PAS domain S-box-containing protein